MRKKKMNDLGNQYLKSFGSQRLSEKRASEKRGERHSPEKGHRETRHSPVKNPESRPRQMSPAKLNQYEKRQQKISDFLRVTHNLNRGAYQK